MKAFLLCLVMFCFAARADLIQHAQIEPYAVADVVGLTTALSKNVKVAKGSFTISTTKAAASTFTFGISIPAGAVISNAYIHPVGVVSADANTVNIGCGGSDNLFSDSLGAGNYNTIEQAFTSYVYTASGCTPTATVGSGTSGVTAGTFNLYVHYAE